MTTRSGCASGHMSVAMEMDESVDDLVVMEVDVDVAVAWQWPDEHQKPLPQPCYAVVTADTQ